VNLASRMESSGSVGEVNISESTYQLIKDYFICEFRGEIDAKNKGKIIMYFVKKLKEEFVSLEEKSLPNEKFLEILFNLKN
ncbi:MAG: hypothetical protein KDK36_12200, partial [Leptospiraceae bacterium]|nr:hypothetical protein [Leptospiraceae bacterium]